MVTWRWDLTQWTTTIKKPTILTKPARKSALWLGLGLATARYLDSILSSFPGLPAAIDFFPFEPRDAWTALGLLVLAGLLAGVYPSWRSASLPIAGTLREEAIA